MEGSNEYHALEARHMTRTATLQAPPPLKHETLSAMATIIATVDRHARERLNYLGEPSRLCYKKRAETLRQQRSALTTAKGTFAMADKPICSIQDCDKPTSIRGWCHVHYQRWRMHGDPCGGRAFNGEHSKFIERAVASQTDDCLIWPYFKNERGYGKTSIKGKSCRVHRVVCEAVHGAPPSPSHETAHSCAVRACANPRHLRWATPVENQADVDAHGNRTSAKLTAKEVREIRALEGKLRGADIGKVYGVSQSAVNNIHLRKTWGWVS